MAVNRQQILTGAANYVRGEVIPKIPDRGFRVVLEAGAVFLEMSPQAADRVFEHPMMKTILREQDGAYDLEFARAALEKAVETHGGIDITVPGIPLVSPAQKTLNFSAADIKTLMRYIAG